MQQASDLKRPWTLISAIQKPHPRGRKRPHLVFGFTFLAVISASLFLRKVRLSQSSTTTPTYSDIYPDTDYPLRPPSEPWDISTSYPYPKTFEKDVSEGTWLRIATHPRRREIVFDMLGDLYCMQLDTAVNGSRRATPLLQGVPYEKDASFSPTGDNIVFISDAGFGVDNIWTLPYSSCEDLATQSPKSIRASAVQQTNSTFRFFSSPAFHPTLPRIIATKWFLTGRPNGAGELWEFPVQRKSSGGDRNHGRRIVGRKLPSSWPPERYGESQIGAEQGRYIGENGDGIIFTQNIRDDDTGMFSYNKDVHKGINAVFIHNTTTQTTEQLVNAKPGGANMPRASHDGKSLAFVRRVKEKSVLVIKDLRSGTLHHIWTELTYDLSTIPSFMGAYPNFGFSPNDSSLVIWSSGHIYEVPLKFNHLGERVAGDPLNMINFTAHINLSLGATRYSKTDIRKTELQKEQQIYALRGLRSNWDGSEVVFEGAGDLYRFQVPKEELIRLPKLSPSAEYYAPSVGQGSSHIIVSKWSDVNLTTFELIRLPEGNSKAVEGVPRGRYISPVVGCGKIAFVRTGADYMFGDVEETAGEGVWLGDISIGSAVNPSAHVTGLRRINRYSAEDTKLEFKHTVRDEICSGADQMTLHLQTEKFVEEFATIDDSAKIVATSKTTMEIAVVSSPQRKSLIYRLESLFGINRPNTPVVFKDFQHIWIAFINDGTMENLSSTPGQSTTPKELVRLSQEGGHDGCFSGNGKLVFWLSGPNLWYASVSDIQNRCSQASFAIRDSGSCARSVAKVVKLNIQQETDISKLQKESEGRSVAFINATIVPMDPTMTSIVKNGTVLIQGGEIMAVGTDVEIPQDAHIISVGDAVVLPGFVDVHGHWGGFLSQYPSASWELESFLGYGVTTIHNPSSSNVGGFVERSLVEKGAFYGPRIYHTGTVLYGSTRPDCYTEINSLQDAREALLRVKIEGGPSSFSVKNYQLQSRSARQRLLLEARELDMIILPEGGWSFDWGITYLIDGMTTHEHPLPVPELYDDVLSLVAASGSSYTQVAVMSYGGLFGQEWVHQENDIPENTKLRKYVKHDILEMLTEVKQAPRHSYQFFNTTISTKKLADAGVRTNIGAHGEQPIGFLFHSEMEMLGMGGQTPYKVLRAATIDAAISLGLNSSIGSISPGKLADLVIYPPGIDTIEKVWRHSRDMLHVVRGGRIFNVSDGLVEIWPRVGRRLPKGRINPEDEG